MLVALGILNHTNICYCQWKRVTIGMEMISNDILTFSLMWWLLYGEFCYETYIIYCVIFGHTQLFTHFEFNCLLFLQLQLLLEHLNVNCTEVKRLSNSSVFLGCLFSWWVMSSVPSSFFSSLSCSTPAVSARAAQTDLRLCRLWFSTAAFFNYVTQGVSTCYV